MKKPIYHKNEIFNTEIASKIIKTEENITESDRDIAKGLKENTYFKITDAVEIQYNGIRVIVRVTRIYNND